MGLLERHPTIFDSAFLFGLSEFKIIIMNIRFYCRSHFGGKKPSGQSQMGSPVSFSIEHVPPL